VTPPRRNLRGILAAIAASIAAAFGVAAKDRAEKAAEAAHLDTFPVYTLRDTTGAVVRNLTLQLGDSSYVCLLARNRYTGQVQIFADKNVTDAAAAEVVRACEVAATAVEAERTQ